MRICVVHQGDLESARGPNGVVRNLIKEWSVSNDVFLVSPAGGEFDSLKVRSHTLPESSDLLGSALWSSGVLSTYKKTLQGCDVIFAQGSGSFAALLLHAKLRSISLPPTYLRVYDEYFYDCLNFRNPITRLRTYARQRVSMSLVDNVITMSNKAREMLIRHFGCGSKMHVISNGVSLREFRRLSLPKENKILFVGDLEAHFYRKGIMTLLKAFALLAKRADDLTLTIAGRVCAKLKEAINDLGLQSRVRVTGFLTPVELLASYNRSRVLVLPSLFDSCPNVVNEAMACGTPVVVSKNVGNSDLVLAAKAGLVFRGNDHLSLYECLVRVLNDGRAADRMGKNGHRYARLNLGWDVIAHKYLSLFEFGGITMNDEMPAKLTSAEFPYV